MSLIGSPPVIGTGQYGSVDGVNRFLISLANPAVVNGHIVRVDAFLDHSGPSSGYLVTFVETSPGIFSSRDYVGVTFPTILAPGAVKTWLGLALIVSVGDFIGIGLPPGE